VDIIKMGLKEIGWGGMDWFDMALSCEHNNEPTVYIKYGEVLE
jgi:hypothetical protein